MKQKDRLYVMSIEKAMAVFFFIANGKEPAGISQLARQLNLSIGAAQRVTFTLEKLGFLKKLQNKQGYILGHKAWGLGLALVRDIDLRNIAHPYLEELSGKIGETVNLAILEGTDIVYLDRIKTEQILNINLNIGSRLPAYCSSMGKAIMAFLPEEEVCELLDKVEMEAFTENTPTDKEKLLDYLKEVRRQGFAINAAEINVGVMSVATPIRGSSGKVVAAVNIAIPSSRVTLQDLKTRYAQDLLRVAAIISEAIGYKA